MGNIINIIPSGVDHLPDMYFEGKHHEWYFRFNLGEILDYVAAQSVTENQRDGEKPIEAIFTPKDHDLVLVYLRSAVANVSMILARRMPHPAEFGGDNITFRLEVGDNHDESMMQVLHLRIMDYLCQYAYLKWTGKDLQSLSKMEDAIRSAMHYRKHGILRRVQNLNI